MADSVREPEGHLGGDRRRGLMLATLDSRLGRAVGFALLVQAHLYPRTLFLQGEEDGAVPGRPAPRDRLGHLLLSVGNFSTLRRRAPPSEDLLTVT